MENFEEVRRQDRLLDTEQITSLLENGEYGILSMGPDANGYAYGVPLSFAYSPDNKSIYFHSALEGKKFKVLATHSKVSFCIVGSTKVLPSKFSTMYQSVIVFGSIEAEISDTEKREALQLLILKYSPDYIESGEKYIDKLFEKTAVLKLDIIHMTGKSRK